MKSAVRQGGSVKVFIIVGVILALVALGVLYGVNRLAMNDQTPPLTVPDQTNTVDDGAGEQSSEGAGDTEGQSSSDDGVDPFAPGQDSDSSSENKGGSNGDNAAPALGGSGTGTSSASSDRDEASELPQTGPAETFAALTLALVAGSVVAYIRSLRHL